MGVLDKIKNALFEVEYVEVEEPPKKEKKVSKPKQKEEKPIAKKIVLPEKKEEKVEKIKEEELADEDFEIKSKTETIKEKKDSFKFIDDNDFIDDYDNNHEKPEILDVIDNDFRVKDNSHVNRRSSYDNNDDYNNGYSEKENKNQNNLYGVDSSYNVPVHEYGTYERKEERSYFKPSPIISPIYGILDKNYRKEDVKDKKEVRLSSYTRTNVSVDDIRNKAYGSSADLEEVPNHFEVEEEDDDNLLVDLSDKKKPEVKELTVGDALEYFQDLGLEYNVDYVDVSKERVTARRSQTDTQKSVEDSVNNESQDIKKNVSDVLVDKNTSKIDSFNDDNDNLFDLIDSMYQDNE